MYSVSVTDYARDALLRGARLSASFFAFSFKLCYN